MQQRQNDPFCCMTLLATEWFLLQQTPYNAFVNGEENPQNCLFPLEFCQGTLPGGPNHSHRQHTQKNLVKIAHGLWRYPRGQTQRQTHRQTCSSQYFATAPVGEVEMLQYVPSWRSLWQKTTGECTSDNMSLDENKHMHYVQIVLPSLVQKWWANPKKQNTAFILSTYTAYCQYLSEHSQNTRWTVTHFNAASIRHNFNALLLESTVGWEWEWDEKRPKAL